MANGHWLPRHLVESSAAAMVFMPTYATLEHIFSNMSWGESFNARKLGILVTFAGLGKGIALGRNLYQRLAHVDTNNNWAVKRHDRIYGVIFNTFVSPPYYLLVGIDDPAKIVAGTITTAIFGYFPQGEILGYALDVSRDITGIEESNRTPAFIKSMTSTQKAFVPIIAGAAAMAATELVWRAPTISMMFDYVVNMVK
jgi:hypothetical protein